MLYFHRFHSTETVLLKCVNLVHDTLCVTYIFPSLSSSHSIKIFCYYCNRQLRCVHATTKNLPYRPTSHTQGTSNFFKASNDHKQEYIQLILLPHLIHRKPKKGHTHQINCHRSRQHMVPGDRRMGPPMDSTPTERVTQVPRTTNILLDGCNSNRIF
jgi:hypothetical protein